jgi:hypothetical protein
VQMWISSPAAARSARCHSRSESAHSGGFRPCIRLEIVISYGRRGGGSHRSSTMRNRRIGRTVRRTLFFTAYPIGQRWPRRGTRCGDGRQTSVDVADIALGGIIVDASTPMTVHQLADDRPIELAVADDPAPSDAAELRPDELPRLMDLADRFARRLVADARRPAPVLMMVHGSELDIVTLDGGVPPMHAAQRLLAGRPSSSAALLFDTFGVPGDEPDAAFYIVGETVAGTRDVRRYRVRPCSSGRRLTRMFERGVSGLQDSVPPPLFARLAATGVPTV